MSALESAAQDVAKQINPDGDLKGIDPISIMTIIITILQGMVQMCPKPPAQIAADLRRPGLRQRAALLKGAMETCKAQGCPERTREIYHGMLAKSSQLNETDALAIVNEAMNDRNLLV